MVQYPLGAVIHYRAGVGATVAVPGQAGRRGTESKGPRREAGPLAVMATTRSVAHHRFDLLSHLRDSVE